MRVNPVTDEELNIMNLIKEGLYDYEIVEAKDKISKSGNEMIELKLKVWDENGSERLLYDYLLDSMPHKLNHFCKANNLLDKYQAGNLLANNCIGRSGKVHVVIQKDKSGQYSDRNAVKDYITDLEKKGSITKPMTNDFVDSDLPF